MGSNWATRGRSCLPQCHMQYTWCLGKLGYIGVHTFLSTQVKPLCPTLLLDSRLQILRINSKICTSICDKWFEKNYPFVFVKKQQQNESRISALYFCHCCSTCMFWEVSIHINKTQKTQKSDCVINDNS